MTEGPNNVPKNFCIFLLGTSTLYVIYLVQNYFYIIQVTTCTFHTSCIYGSSTCISKHTVIVVKYVLYSLNVVGFSYLFHIGRGPSRYKIVIHLFLLGHLVLLLLISTVSNLTFCEKESKRKVVLGQ